MKKILFFNCLLFVNFNFGSGSVREHTQERYAQDAEKLNRLKKSKIGRIVAAMFRLR